MNEQLQNALAEIIKSLTAAANQVGAVAQEQLPLLVREYLAWGYWGAVLDIAMWVAASVLLMAVSLLLWRITGRVDGDDEVAVGAAVVVSIATVVVLVATVFVVASAIQTLVQISVAPRVYLLEQVSQLVK